MVSPTLENASKANRSSSPRDHLSTLQDPSVVSDLFASACLEVSLHRRKPSHLEGKRNPRSYVHPGVSFYILGGKKRGPT